MISIVKLNIIIINVIVCSSLAKLNSSAISDYSKDNRSKNHDNIKQLHDKRPSNVAVNTEQSSNERQHITAANDWDTEAEQLEKSLLGLEGENGENKCLLDSLKTAIVWWCHRNGTLRETNLNILSHQEQLDLSHHNISHDRLAANVVAERLKVGQTASLGFLSLAHNNLTTVPYHTLQLIADSLKYLSLKANPFIDATNIINATDESPARCILNENDMKFIKIRNTTKLTTIASNRKQLAWATFPKMPALLELDISDCDIKYINKKAFQNLTNLKNLYMSHNKLLNLPADTFSNTPHLQVLDLSFVHAYDSLIHRIIYTPGFESMLKLFYGVNIEPNFFDHLPNLIYLDLSHTKLRSGSAAAFSRLRPTLKYLSLCYTSFPGFGKGSSFGNSSLIGLDLSGNANAVASLSADSFAGLSQSLRFLFFEEANLKELTWLKPLTNLYFLALAGNSINYILADDFSHLQQLKILDLSSNRVSNWYSRAFQHNKNLQILGLRDNNINFISSAMLGDFSTLVYLSLGGNNFICDCVLHDLVDVSSINNRQAQCNRSISHANDRNIRFGSTYLPAMLKNFKLFFNSSWSTLDIPSLIVHQNLHKFKQTVKKIQHKLQSGRSQEIRYILTTLRNQNNTQACLHEHNSTAAYISHKFNSSILKLQLLDYKEEHYWCYNQSRKENLRRLNCQRAHVMENIEQELNMLTTYILAFVGGIILIASMGIFVYAKRWHIYYYYSSVKSAALLSAVSKDKHDNFKNLCDQNSGVVYDVFISYCQNDRDWIVEELMPNIEETGDISVCLHERDFQVGITILDNIVSCMERSRAMLLIISANFLLSHWCQFEMQLAHHHILDLKKDNLILVLLEDIPRNKRPKNLQFLMNVKTYIKWPGGKCKDNVHPEERKLFWKRLKRTLKNASYDHRSESIA